MPSRSKPSERGAEVVAPDALDGDVAVGDGGEPDEAADLDVVGADRVAGAAERACRPRWCRCSTRSPRSARPAPPGSRARSWTCGSEAAFRRTVRPLAGHGGHQGVLGAGDAGLVEEDVGADQAPWPRRCSRSPTLHFGAQVLEGQEVGVHPAAPDDVAAGRRQGDAAEAGEHAGRRAGWRRGSGRRAGDRAAWPGRPWCRSRTALGPTHSTVAPRCARSSSMLSTSLMRGTFSSSQGPSARSVAARMGRAAFLLPAGRMVPLRARPPRTLYRSGMREQYQRVPRRQAHVALAIGRPQSMFSHAAPSAGHAGLGRADHGDLARHHCLRLRHHRHRGCRPWPGPLPTTQGPARPDGGRAGRPASGR